MINCFSLIQGGRPVSCSLGITTETGRVKGFLSHVGIVSHLKALLCRMVVLMVLIIPHLQQEGQEVMG